MLEKQQMREPEVRIVTYDEILETQKKLLSSEFDAALLPHANDLYLGTLTKPVFQLDCPCRSLGYPRFFSEFLSVSWVPWAMG